MKKVITYGTFDLLHYGHQRLLERAKSLGDYLIVGVTSDTYDKERGKLNVHQSLLERIENVKKLKLADKVIVEEYEGQKIQDIQKYSIDIFAIGSDWIGNFDYLNEYCKVIYLERTRGISSTQLRMQNNPVLSLGIIGSGRIAKRFIKESKYVSGVNVTGVYNPHLNSAKIFADNEELEFFTDNIEFFFSKIDMVYIASPHQFHFSHIKSALNHNCHVLCEKPMTLSSTQSKECFDLANKKGKILMEAIKTAYCPAFEHLLILAKSGRLGEIKDIEATFTKLILLDTRELNPEMAGGSINELASYVLLPIIKLLGDNIKQYHFYSDIQNKVDIFTRGILKYPHATGNFKVGLGAKSEGDLIITGTKGYIYVPAPWWKTNYFEMRFEDLRDTEKYFYKFEGDGLRYELVEFINRIYGIQKHNKLTEKESIAISYVIEQYHVGNNTDLI
jgi:glycerol-3-phosphate cytidylyltransferase